MDNVSIRVSCRSVLCFNACQVVDSLALNVPLCKHTERNLLLCNLLNMIYGQFTFSHIIVSALHLKEREMEKEIYRDCQRNHACYLGGYAIDGCSEFIPSNTLESYCKACGCHRNYRRKVLLIDLEVQSPEKGKEYRQAASCSSGPYFTGSATEL